MKRVENTEFTNMCMICDSDKVVVIDRQKKDCTPDAQACAQGNYQSLKNANCAIEKFHILFPP